MAIAGLVVNEGLYHCIEAMSKGGWKIYPYGFAVSSEISEFTESRNYDSMNPTWYTGKISGRIVINVHTIEFLCTVPPQATDTSHYIREVYIISLDESGNPFLLAFGQTKGDAIYDPSGSVKLRIQISIQNVNMVDLFVFKYTQAQELFDHNYDPNAHPDIREELAKLIEEHDINPNSHPYILELIKVLRERLEIYEASTNNLTGISLPGIVLPLGEKVHVIRTAIDSIYSTDQYVMHRDAKGSLVREMLSEYEDN